MEFLILERTGQSNRKCCMVSSPLLHVADMSGPLCSGETSPVRLQYIGPSDLFEI